MSNQPGVATRPSQILIKKLPHVPIDINSKNTKFQPDMLNSFRDIDFLVRVVYARSAIASQFLPTLKVKISAIY